MLYVWIVCIICVLVYCWLLVSRKFRILDKPHKYADIRWRKPIPTLQWVFLYIIFVIILAVFFPDILTWQIGISLLLWWLPLVVAGMLDDVFFEKISLPARSRFLLQICVWLWVTIYADLGFSQFAVLWFVVEFWYWWGVLLSTLRFVW